MRRRRQGTVLVLFAILVFAILALGGLIVDLGIARVTQAQLQDLADGAAREGLRTRDGDPDNVLDAATYAALTDAEREDLRRLRAAEWVTLALDANLAPLTDDANGEVYGAGPTVAFDDGIDGTYMGRTLVGTPGLFRPNLEPNPTDEPHGDLVAGTYDPAASHDEANDYSRLDFASAGGAAGASAFLARLRRTHPDRDPLARQAGVSSSGPTLPYTLGAGATIAGSGDYDPREHGITVRATAIADARPARRVGRGAALAGGSLEGAVTLDGVGVDVVLGLNVWQDPVRLPTDVEVELTLNTTDQRNLEVAGDVYGRLLPDTEDPRVLSAPVADVAVGAAIPGAGEVVGFVPIVAAVDGGEWVVGFGRARVRRIDATRLGVTVLTAEVAPRNASGVLRSAPGLGAGLSETGLEALLAVNAGLERAVLAPVRVR